MRERLNIIENIYFTKISTLKNKQASRKTNLGEETAGAGAAGDGRGRAGGRMVRRTRWRTSLKAAVSREAKVGVTGSPRARTEEKWIMKLVNNE